MPWWAWLALGLFLAVLIGGAVAATLMAIRVFRAFAVAQRSVFAALDEVAAAAAALEQRAAAAADRGEEVARRVESLRGSLDRLSVLTWALGDARRAVARLREAVPRK